MLLITCVAANRTEIRRVAAFRLGEWLVTPDDGSLTRPGRSTRLEPQIMALLLYLCERAGNVVPKNEILDNVWRSRYISDETLKSAFHGLRKALGDDSRAPRYIETLPKRGYRMLVQPSNLGRSVHERARALVEADRTPASLNQARLYYERALENDQHDAQAHAGLAQTLTSLALAGEGSENALDTAVVHVQRALALDPDKAEANAIAATLAFIRDRDAVRANELFARAMQLESKNSAVLRAYSRFLTAQSRHAEAVENAAAAFAADPVSVNVERDLVEALFAARRYDEALAQARRMLDRHPDAADIRLGMTYIYFLQGDPTQAYAAFVSGIQHMGVQDAVLAKVREAFEAGGMPQVFARWLEMLEREAMLGRKVSRDVIALHALLGHNDYCFELLEIAAARREPFILWLAPSPLLDRLRVDPRFSQLFPNG